MLFEERIHEEGGYRGTRPMSENKTRSVERVKLRLKSLGFHVEIRPKHSEEDCFEQGIGSFKVPVTETFIYIDWMNDGNANG